MGIRKHTYKVEEIGNGLNNLTGLGYAVYEAIYHGTYTPAAYEGALSILVNEIRRLSELTDEVIEEMYEELKHEKK